MHRIRRHFCPKGYLWCFSISKRWINDLTLAYAQKSPKIPKFWLYMENFRKFLEFNLYFNQQKLPEFTKKILAPVKKIQKLGSKWPRVILWSRVLNGSLNEFWINHFHTIDSIRVHLIFFFIPTEISITLFMIFGDQDKGDQSKSFKFRRTWSSKQKWIKVRAFKMNGHEEQSRLPEVCKACQPGRPGKLNDRPIVLDRLIWSIFVYYLPFTISPVYFHSSSSSISALFDRLHLVEWPFTLAQDHSHSCDRPLWAWILLRTLLYNLNWLV